MRIGSRMAALASIFTLAMLVSPAARSQTPKPADAPIAPTPTPTRSRSDRPSDSIELCLVIAGLGRAGCDVDVKPGNPSSKFHSVNDQGKEARQHVTAVGRATLKLKDVEISSADRTCSVAITIHESGQAPRTIHRAFRLPKRPEGLDAAAKKSNIPSFTCFLSSPSRLARNEESRSRK